MTMVYEYNYHNSGNYPLSCLFFLNKVSETWFCLRWSQLLWAQSKELVSAFGQICDNYEENSFTRIIMNDVKLNLGPEAVTPPGLGWSGLEPKFLYNGWNLTKFQYLNIHTYLSDVRTGDIGTTPFPLVAYSGRIVTVDEVRDSCWTILL
jgi:hypothetical protein